MHTFKVNNYITLSLENKKTVIYVNNEEFMQCKSLLLDIPVNHIQFFDVARSIDDAAEILTWSESEQESIEYTIPPEIEFWGHCSNMQAWVEHDYDTRLVHSNLAFPLLKKLTDIGDLKAKHVFKLEIIRRFIEGSYSTREFLIDRKYLDYLTEEDIRVVLPVEEVMTLEELEKELNLDFSLAYFLETITEPNEWPDNFYYVENYRIVGLKIIKPHIEKVPESIGDLKELKYLDLSYNFSKFIPESIGKLDKLEFLDLTCNNFDDIPDSIENLKKLKTCFSKFHLHNQPLQQLLNLKKLNQKRFQFQQKKSLQSLN